MRKYPRNVEEKDNYLSLLIFPNLMLYIIAFAGFDYFYNNVFCEFKAELHLTKILYFLMIVICSYNASKLILTLVEFPYRTYKGEHYTYRNKFNFFKAIYKKQFFRIFIMFLLFFLCMLIHMNLKAFDYEITPEHQTNIKENQSVVSSSDLKDDDSILLAEITIEENKNIILINRPEIPQKETDKNLFWYVIQNGKLCKCFQAYRKTWTNFLTFADNGDYTVTLVTDYYADTGEYTPISNTIEYTIE